MWFDAYINVCFHGHFLLPFPLLIFCLTLAYVLTTAAAVIVIMDAPEPKRLYLTGEEQGSRAGSSSLASCKDGGSEAGLAGGNERKKIVRL